MKSGRVQNIINNPKKGLWILAVPLFVSMIVQTLYNIVDTAFVGRLGAESIAALTFAWPVFFIFISLNEGLGAGISSRISRFLGEKNKKQAENTAMHGVFLSIIIAIILFILGFIFIRPLLSLFGASGQTLELAIDYMQIIFIGGGFLLLMGIFNRIFTSQGDAKTAMKIMVSTLIINIILDPIFIYVLGYGVKGAAIATTIAFFFGFMLSLYYIKTKSDLDIKLSSYKFSKTILKQINKVSFPATIMMLTTAFTFMFLNRFISYFGVDYVAAAGLSFRLEHIAITPVLAVSLSMIPLVGMLYGAKQYHKLKSISLYGLKLNLLFSTIVGAILFLFPGMLLRIFTSDPNILAIGVPYLRIMVFAYPIMAVGYLVGRVLQGIGVGLPALIINLLRGILIPVPFFYIFIFVLGYGYLSIPFAMIIGAIVSSFIGIVWLERKLKKIHIEIIKK